MMWQLRGQTYPHQAILCTTTPPHTNYDFDVVLELKHAMQTSDGIGGKSELYTPDEIVSCH